MRISSNDQNPLGPEAEGIVVRQILRKATARDKRHVTGTFFEELEDTTVAQKSEFLGLH